MSERNLCGRLFYLFATIHLLVWTLIPTWFLKTIPLDTAEGIMWGRAWQWGSYKHPPLAAWLSQIFFLIQGYPGFSLYLLSQIMVVITFWAVWKLGLRLLTPVQALASVMCLEGIYYYTFPTIQFNPDILMLPLWALTTLLLYIVLKRYSIIGWLGIGLLAGLGMLAKYESAVLLVPMLLLLVITSAGRENFKRLGIYLAAIIFGIIITPHLLWLVHNNFLPLKYASASSALVTATQMGIGSRVTQHILQPAHYLLDQILAILPALGLLLILQSCRKTENRLDKFNLKFLITVCLGPFLLTLLLSILLGIKIKGYWAIPYFSFIGIFILYLFKPSIARKNFSWFILATAFIFILIAISTPVVFYCYPYLTNRVFHEHYPAQNVASYLTKLWNKNQKQRLRYIAGPRDAVSYIASYSSARPEALIEFNPAESPWLTMQDVREYGGVFVTDGRFNPLMWRELKIAFPKLETPQAVKFKYLTKAKVAPLTIYVALLPAASS